MLTVALAVGSSVVYGVSDFLGGRRSRSLPLLAVLLVSQGSALVLLAAVVIGLGEGPPGGEFVLYAVLAGTSEAVGVAALASGSGACSRSARASLSGGMAISASPA